jgi:predicted nucleotidyltransferase
MTTTLKTPSRSRNNRQAAARPQLTTFRRTLQKNLPELRARYHVSSLGLFGSFVRGEARKQSDLDVLVEYDQAPSFFEFIDLEERLSSLLGTKVDLVMKSALKPRIGERILAEVVPV